VVRQRHDRRPLHEVVLDGVPGRRGGVSARPLSDPRRVPSGSPALRRGLPPERRPARRSSAGSPSCRSRTTPPTSAARC
jgi:hypothetical protein